MGIEVSGWLGQLLIAAPYALLLLVILLFLHRRREVEETGPAHATLRHGRPSGSGTTAVAPQPPAAPQAPPPPAFAAPGPPPAPEAAAAAPAAPSVRGNESATEPEEEPATQPRSGLGGSASGAVVPPASPPLRPLAPPPQAIVAPAAQPPLPPPGPPAAAPRPAAPAAPASPPAAPGIVPIEALSSSRVTTTIAEPAAPPPKPAQRVPSVEEVNAALERAIAADKKSDVALLSLYLARRQKASGTADVGELLRRAVRMSAELGLKDLHAEARLDLGEEARAAGDLTTACEHWQIARSLFEEGSQKAKAENVEARMKRFGCPTDWVLNDF